MRDRVTAKYRDPHARADGGESGIGGGGGSNNISNIKYV